MNNINDEIYIAELEKIESAIAVQNTKKYQLQQEYIKYLTEVKYAYFLDKKIEFTLKPLFKDMGETIQRWFFHGFQVRKGVIYPVIHRLKKDGTESTRPMGVPYRLDEIISIKEA